VCTHKWSVHAFCTRHTILSSSFFNLNAKGLPYISEELLKQSITSKVPSN
jgi:hypothetical protein